MDRTSREAFTVTSVTRVKIIVLKKEIFRRVAGAEHGEGMVDLALRVAMWVLLFVVLLTPTPRVDPHLCVVSVTGPLVSKGDVSVGPTGTGRGPGE